MQKSSRTMSRSSGEITVFEGGHISNLYFSWLEPCMYFTSYHRLLLFFEWSPISCSGDEVIPISHTQEKEIREVLLYPSLVDGVCQSVSVLKLIPCQFSDAMVYLCKGNLCSIFSFYRNHSVDFSREVRAQPGKNFFSGCCKMWKQLKLF